MTLVFVLWWYCEGGCNIEGEEDSWDFGTGAGFYVDATEEKWKSHYRMYTYITKEVWAVYLKMSLISWVIYVLVIAANQ